MPKFIVVADETHKAFFNLDAITTFRVKHDARGKFTNPVEIEIEFAGGTKTKLVGDPAEHFVQAIDSL